MYRHRNITAPGKVREITLHQRIVHRMAVDAASLKQFLCIQGIYGCLPYTETRNQIFSFRLLTGKQAGQHAQYIFLGRAAFQLVAPPVERLVINFISQLPE